jgi:hypothetical protein
VILAAIAIPNMKPAPKMTSSPSLRPTTVEAMRSGNSAQAYTISVENP